MRRVAACCCCRGGQSAARIADTGSGRGAWRRTAGQGAGGEGGAGGGGGKGGRGGVRWRWRGAGAVTDAELVGATNGVAASWGGC